MGQTQKVKPNKFIRLPTSIQVIKFQAIRNFKKVRNYSYKWKRLNKRKNDFLKIVMPLIKIKTE